MNAKRNVLSALLRAYAEEGYGVTVGLNPFRESRHGSFALSAKLEPLELLPKYKDEYFVSIFPVGPSSSSELAIYRKKFDRYIKIQGSIWGKAKLLLNKSSLVKGIKGNSREFRTDKDSRSRIEKTRPSYFVTGGGISIEEIYFFENILNSYEAKREFLVGLGAGWSTIAIGLINPSAQIYGIDNLSEGKDAREGLALADRIAKKLSIKLKIHSESSPEDVPGFFEGIGE